VAELAALLEPVAQARFRDALSEQGLARYRSLITDEAYAHLAIVGAHPKHLQTLALLVMPYASQVVLDGLEFIERESPESPEWQLTDAGRAVAATLAATLGKTDDDAVRQELAALHAERSRTLGLDKKRA
jgi:hypothetical protein